MASPVIFNGRFSKLLTSRGVLGSTGILNEYDGARNYYGDCHFEQDVTKATLFNTTITSSIPTGSVTAGASSLSASQETTSPLRGVGSLKITASSGWTQGHGFYLPTFTVDGADLGRVLTFKLYYSATSGASNANWSGTLGSQSLMVAIYDVTNSAWIVPSSAFGFNQSSGSGFITGSFQSSGTSGQQYRLCILASQAVGTGLTMLFDDFYLGPQTAPVGTVVSEWQTSWTPTGSWTGNVSYAGKWRRVGDTAEFQVTVSTTGAPTGSGLTINLPSGMVIDTNKINSGTSDVIHVGTAKTLDTGVAAYGLGSVKLITGVTTYVSCFATNSAATYTTESSISPTVPFTFGNGDSVDVVFKVPIVGWGATSAFSNDSDTRVVAAQARTTSQTFTAGAAAAQINFSTVNKDTHGAVTTGASWKYTAPVTGYYRVQGAATFSSATYTTGAALGLYLYVDGSAEQDLAVTTQLAATANVVTLPFSYGVYLNAGQYVDLRCGIGGSVNASITKATIYISRESGPAVIAANETVAMRMARITSDQTGVNPNGTAVKISFNDATTAPSFLVNGSFSSGTFTVQQTGTYVATASVNVAGTNVISTGFYGIRLYKNGAYFMSVAGLVAYANGTELLLTGSSSPMKLVAGDTVDFYLYGSGNNSVSTLTVRNGTEVTWASLTRVGL